MGVCVGGVYSNSNDIRQSFSNSTEEEGKKNKTKIICRSSVNGTISICTWNGIGSIDAIFAEQLSSILDYLLNSLYAFGFESSKK